METSERITNLINSLIQIRREVEELEEENRNLQDKLDCYESPDRPNPDFEGLFLNAEQEISDFLRLRPVSLCTTVPINELLELFDRLKLLDSIRLYIKPELLNE